MKTKIKFIIDESVDYTVVQQIRKSGYDATSIAEDFPSMDDTEILKSAYVSNRILITNDKDFGTLIFKENLKSHGVVLLRLEDQSEKSILHVLELILINYVQKLYDNFVVVSESKVRIRKL